MDQREGNTLVNPTLVRCSLSRVVTTGVVATVATGVLSRGKGENIGSEVAVNYGSLSITSVEGQMTVNQVVNIKVVMET